jgi:hypothetical protein
MSARLSTSLLVGSLIRRAEAEGGFAAVILKGDATAGSVLVLLTERGGKLRILERLLQPDGTYKWQPTGTQDTENKQEISAFFERRKRYDPDLWVIELDVPSLERFAAEMNASN